LYGILGGVGDGKVGVAGGADRRSSTVDTLCQSSLQQQSVRGRQMSLLSLLLRARGEFFACFTSYNFYFPTPALLMLINWMGMGLEVGGWKFGGRRSSLACLPKLMGNCSSAQEQLKQNTF